MWGAVCVWMLLPCQAPLAQDFPYAVPQAPEFDTGNGLLPPGSIEEPAPDPRMVPPAPSHSRRSRSSGERKTDYRAVRPYVPRDTPPPAMASPQSPPIPAGPQIPVTEAPQIGNPAMASTPAGPPPQMEPRLDCSKFPMLIAQAKSDQEMQWTARLYLTCLVRSGWNENDAKKQVISTIEGTYRLAR